MIIPDINLLVHAYNEDSPVHSPARRWLEDLLSAPTPVGVPWVVALGFIRITTHPRVVSRPLTPDVACRHVETWLGQPQVMLIQAGDRHAAVLFDLLRRLGTAANLTTDAHLAALTIEYQAELHSTDADFARFAGLRWRNPLVD